MKLDPKDIGFDLGNSPRKLDDENLFDIENLLIGIDDNLFDNFSGLGTKPNKPQCKQCGKDLNGYQCNIRSCLRYDVLKKAYDRRLEKQKKEIEDQLLD